MERDADMGKRRRCGLGEKAHEHDNSVADQQPFGLRQSVVEQPESNTALGIPLKAKVMWQYIFLVLYKYSGKTRLELEMQSLDLIREIFASRRASRLLEFPRHRDVQWVARSSPDGVRTDLVKALLVQVTGIELEIMCYEVSIFPESSTRAFSGMLCGFSLVTYPWLAA